MTQVRRYLEDGRHTICRRTVERRRFLTPTEETNALVRYALLLTASRHAEAVELSAFCCLSTHYHLSCCDKLGGKESRLPRFLGDYNALLARSLNAQLGRGGALWDQGSYDNVEVHGGEAAEIEQLLYVWTQPVVAGLVEFPEQWPGVIFLPEDIGKTHTATRPDDAFFGTRSKKPPSEIPLLRAEVQLKELRERTGGQGKQFRRARRRRDKLAAEAERTIATHGRKPRADPRRATKPKQERAVPRLGSSTLPETVSYTLQPPAALRHLPLPVVRKRLRDALDARLAQIHAERAGHAGYLGARRVVAQDPHKAGGDSLPAFARNPRIACQGLPKAERLALYDGLVAFRKAHREGVDELLRGNPKRARFPAGSHLRAQERARLIRALRMRAPPRAA